MEYIIELYEFLTPEQREILSSYGKITYENKYIHSVIMKTDKSEATLKLGFIKNVEKSREGTWIDRKLHEEKIPRLTPMIYETIKLTRALEESIGGLDKGK